MVLLQPINIAFGYFLNFKAFVAAGVSVSLAGSEGVKICDLCYCEATPDQVVSQMTEVPEVTSYLSVS